MIFFSQRRHSSGSSLLEALDEEETKRLAECLEQILDVVGESMPEVHGNFQLYFSVIMSLPVLILCFFMFFPIQLIIFTFSNLKIFWRVYQL